MLVFAVPVLAHDPKFTSHTDVQQLKVIQQCLWFILEPLIVKNEYYCYGFYKSLVEKMKSSKNTLTPEDESMNNVRKCFKKLKKKLKKKKFNLIIKILQKLWAVCDIAMNVIYTKTTNFDMKEFPSKTRIPSMYFKYTEDQQTNMKNYLPVEMQISMVNTTKGKGLFSKGIIANERPRRGKGKQKEVGIGPNETDAKVS